MKNLFSRRKFLQAATVTASATMLPSIQGCSSGSGNGKKEVIAGELPKRRLGRTNRMVSCIGFSFHVWSEAIKKAFNEFDIDAVLYPINAARYTGCEDNVINLAR